MRAVEKPLPDGRGSNTVLLPVRLDPPLGDVGAVTHRLAANSQPSLVEQKPPLRPAGMAIAGGSRREVLRQDGTHPVDDAISLNLELAERSCVGLTVKAKEFASNTGGGRGWDFTFLKRRMRKLPPRVSVDQQQGELKLVLVQPVGDWAHRGDNLLLQFAFCHPVVPLRSKADPIYAPISLSPNLGVTGRG